MARSLLVLFALLLGVVSLAACGDTGQSAGTSSTITGSQNSPKEPPSTPWGGAIFGLRIGLDPAKAEFAQGEDLIFTIRAENVLDKPFKLPRFADGAWGFMLGFQGEKGGTDYSCRGPALDSSPANDYVIKPGETWSKQINLSNGGQFSKSGVGPVDGLPPDLYEIFGGYTNHKGEGYWTGGHCWSNGVTIRIR